jgi:hypothetical protein
MAPANGEYRKKGTAIFGAKMISQKLDRRTPAKEMKPPEAS